MTTEAGEKLIEVNRSQREEERKAPIVGTVIKLAARLNGAVFVTFCTCLVDYPIMESDLYRSSVYASCGSTHYGAYTMAKAYGLELCEYLNFLLKIDPVRTCQMMNLIT